MSAATERSHRSSYTRPFPGRASLALTGALAAIAIGTAMRAFVNSGEAFWFDEVWTAAIAIQDWDGAIDMLQADVVAPLYFVFVWVWSKIFGLSNVALRAPGMILSIAAPLLPLLMLRGRLPRYEQCLYTILIALWIPGLYYSQEARTYGFVHFGSVLQTVFFFRVLHSNGDRREIAGWALAGLFLGTTHYIALTLAGVQGLTMLALYWRSRFVSLVLAGLAYVPVFLLIFIQSDTINQYIHYPYFWLKPLAIRDLARAASFLSGDKLIFPFLALIVAAAAVADARAADTPGPGIVGRALRTWGSRLREGLSSPLFVTGLMSLLGLALFLAVTVFRPLFLPRYLMPFAPGLFMLLVWVVAAMPSCRRWAGALLAGLFFLAASIWAGISVQAVDKELTWEEESGILEAAGVSDVLFFLDQGFPIPYRGDIQSKVYGFYFDRDGYKARVRVFSPDFATFADPRPDLERFLGEKPGRGVIWTLSPGPLPGPLPEERAARVELIRARGFSAFYGHTALGEIEGVTCRTTGPRTYRKYVCFSKSSGIVRDRPAPAEE